MDKKKIWPALALCAVLFAAALAITSLSSQGEAQAPGTVAGSDIVISEVMTSNRTYPSPEGRHLDYIEVHNQTGKAVDISNYKLSDDGSSIGYTFPQGTVLPAHGYAVCWCDSASADEAYASFQLSKNGGETVYLYNSGNAVIDQQLLPKTAPNTPLVRQADGTLTEGDLGTPGYENTQEGYDAWLAAMGSGGMNVVISEVQTANYCIALDETGTMYDWIELYNAGLEPAILDGGYLSDDPEDPLKWQIGSLTIQPGEYALIPCAGSAAGAGQADFSLPRDGCTVTLTGSMGFPLSQTEVPELNRGYTWAMQEDGSYAQTAYVTPGFENTDAGYRQWLASVGAADVNVVISEVQTLNCSAITDSRGRLCDWVELYNAGSSAAILDGAFLSDDAQDHIKWQLPSLTLEPGERFVVKCVGADAGENEANFSLDRNGCTIVLSGPAGNIISQTQVPFLNKDRSWALLEDGTYAETDLISPGYENTEEGYLQFRGRHYPTGELTISEVMPSNNRYLMQSDGRYYDWIELFNNSASPIDLSNYAISNDANELLKFPLPQQTLQPGERVVVICSGNSALAGSYIQAPFTLSREESWLYVSYTDGTLCDYIRISNVPYEGSVGRATGDWLTLYFTTPTPNQENGEGKATISDVPFVETPGGVYNGVESVSVILSGEGQIRYTLDGSVPTQDSPVYTAPISLTKSTSLRAVCFSEGKLPSSVVTASYIINENHTLPVLTVSVDPDEMFGRNGIYTRYTRDIEIPCNLTLYEEGGGFTIDCGIKLHGHTGLSLDKKSFRVNFRGRYGSKVLGYPVFGEDEPQVFDSLCIRAGQDYPQSIIREELFTSLCKDMSDNVLVQDSKYCILYINGEYFGIYSLKQAFTELFYAQQRNVAEDSVTMVQAPVDYGTEIHQLMQYLKRQKMAEDENYAYAESVINVDSLIDWMIIEGYSTNGDVQQNLRYFRSTETGNRWEFAYYDLDWAFYYHRPFTQILGQERSWQHMMITNNMMNNPKFRQRFLERLSYHMKNALSNEHVLGRIDELEQLLLPEIPRERERWGGSLTGWQSAVNRLRTFITDQDHLGDIVDHLKVYIGLTSEEIETYFKEWD